MLRIARAYALTAAFTLSCASAQLPAPSASSRTGSPAAETPPSEPAPQPRAHDSAGEHGHTHGHDDAHAHGHEHDDTHPTATHRFDDVTHWVRVFDDPSRDAWQRPAYVVGLLALSPSDTVADLGTGTGYFVPHLSKAVPRGQVLAVDVEERLLEHVRQRAQKAGLGNVRTVLARTDDATLPGGVNVVLLVNTYHHIGKRIAYFRAIGERLGQTGRVVIVDFKLGKFPVGPPDSHKLAPEKVEQELTAAGFGRCMRDDTLPYQYALVFSRACR